MCGPLYESMYLLLLPVEHMMLYKMKCLTPGKSSRDHFGPCYIPKKFLRCKGSEFIADLFAVRNIHENRKSNIFSHSII